MKRVMTVLLFISNWVFSQTTLSQGDIAIIRVEATNPDEFAFVALKDLTANTIIHFTDNGFTAGTTGRTGEGFLTYTAPSFIAEGTVVNWQNGMTITGTGWSSNNPSNFAFNASGDQLFAFQGSTGNWGTQSGITLIFGINYGGNLSSTSSASNTVQPSALGTAFLNLSSSSANNCYYAKGTSSNSTIKKSGTANCILTDILLTNKWFTQSNATGNATNPTTVSFSGVKLNSSIKSNIIDQCLDANWTYYGDDDGLYFAINKNGNTLNPTVDITLSSGAVDSSKSSNGANQEHASYLMKRYWNVNCGGCSLTTNGGVSVRFFYDPADTVAARTAMRNGYKALKSNNTNTLADTTKAMEWIKNNSGTYSPAFFLGNKATGAHTKLTPIYGSQNGVSYVQFDTIKSFSGGGGGFGYGPSSGGGGVGLPVTWASFAVEANDGGNKLLWSTASEQNTSHYEIEYSTDGIRFERIQGDIAAAGNSASLLSYSYQHTFYAAIVYYRIKQVDLDGQYSYSKTVVVKNSYISKENFVSLTANIIEKDIPLLLKGLEKEASRILVSIYNAQGQRILFEKLSTADGYYHQEYLLHDLTAGLYYIHVSDQDQKNIYTGKIRK